MQNPKLINQRVSYLLEKYIKGECSTEEAQEILGILEDVSNDEQIKSESYKVWNDLSEANDQEDSMYKILDKLHSRITRNEKETKSKIIIRRLINSIIRVAAVLLIPVIIYSTIVTFKIKDSDRISSNQNFLNTITVPAGVQSDFILPDGSHIWLNSGSVFKYPVSFSKKYREVELTGEGYFNVIKDSDHPFIVKAGNLNIEVKGTTFNVINYGDDDQIEVILESGEVNLFTGDNENPKLIALMKPGERGIYNTNMNKSSIQKVDVNKYTAWKNGVLIFREDPMNEVVKKLSHRFNVDIEIQNLDLTGYMYTATFIHESLSQILDLLKISAPIQYTIINQEQLDDNSYSRSKIIITKIKKKPMINDGHD